MKCDELKKRLADKDQEVKEIKDNTISIFEDVKDLIVDDLIQRTIENEFKGGEMIHSSTVYRIILDKAKIERSYVYYDNLLTSPKYLLSYPSFKSAFMGIPVGDKTAERKEAYQQYQNVCDFFKKFDYKLFSSMLKEYILSKGFKQAVITNIWNQKVETDFFVITRSQLENQCCSTKSVVRDEELNPYSSKASLGLLILFSVIIAIIAILK